MRLNSMILNMSELPRLGVFFASLFFAQMTSLCAVQALPKDDDKANPQNRITVQPSSFSTKFNVLVDKNSAYVLEPFQRIACCSENLNRNLPVVYCYNSTKKEFDKLWMTAEVWISLKPDQFELYWGSDEVEVRDEFANHQSLLKVNVFQWRSKTIALNPFNSTCFGIVSNQDYELELIVEYASKAWELQTIFGLIILLSSGFLSRQSSVFYVLGTTSGVLLSFLVVFYFLINLLPFKKTTAVSVFLGGGSILMYLMNWIWSSFSVFIMQHNNIIKLYFATSGVVSFLICYKYGPPNDRTKTILKWIFQVAGAALMFMSTHNKEAMVFVIAVCAVLFKLPVLQLIFRVCWSILEWFFQVLYLQQLYFFRLIENLVMAIIRPRNQRRLLTMEEYKRIGRMETKQALNEFSEEFHSHLVENITVLDRLSNQARSRMLGFLQGQNHVNEVERNEHAKMYPDEYILTDDED